MTPSVSAATRLAKVRICPGTVPLALVQSASSSTTAPTASPSPSLVDVSRASTATTPALGVPTGCQVPATLAAYASRTEVVDMLSMSLKRTVSSSKGMGELAVE